MTKAMIASARNVPQQCVCVCVCVRALYLGLGGLGLGLVADTSYAPRGMMASVAGFGMVVGGWRMQRPVVRPGSIFLGGLLGMQRVGRVVS